MNTTYRLILSNATGLQDAQLTSDYLNSPTSLLLTCIQLHAAQRVSCQTRFVNPNYETLVHLGSEEEALLQARLTKSIAGLENIYAALKSKGIERLDLLDEMILMVKRQSETRHYAQYLSNHLKEAERYKQSLEVLDLVCFNYSNHVGILIQTTEILTKFSRSQFEDKRV